MTNPKSPIPNLKFAILALLLLVSCSSLPTTQPPDYPTTRPTDQPTIQPSDQPTTPDATAAAFLDAWQSGDYGTMYARLSPASQVAIDADSFTQRYRNALANGTVLTVTTRLQSVLREEDRAHVAFRTDVGHGAGGHVDHRHGDVAQPARGTMVGGLGRGSDLAPTGGRPLLSDGLHHPRARQHLRPERAGIGDRGHRSSPSASSPARSRTRSRFWRRWH